MSETPRRDIFDVLTLFTAVCGVAFALWTLYDTAKGGKETADRAERAITKVAELAAAASQQNVLLSQQLDQLKTQVYAETEMSKAATAAANLQAKSNIILSSTAKAESSAANALSSAARVQAESLDLQSAEFKLTYRPILQLQLVKAAGPILDNHPQVLVRYKITNIGTMPALKYSFKTDGTYRQKLMGALLDERAPLEDQRRNCVFHDEKLSSFSPTYDQLLPTASTTLVATAVNVGALVRDPSSDNIIYSGCLSYKDSYTETYHHIGFSFNVKIDRAQPNKTAAYDIDDYPERGFSD